MHHQCMYTGDILISSLPQFFYSEKGLQPSRSAPLQVIEGWATRGPGGWASEPSSEDSTTLYLRIHTPHHLVLYVQDRHRASEWQMRLTHRQRCMDVMTVALGVWCADSSILMTILTYLGLLSQQTRQILGFKTERLHSNSSQQQGQRPSPPSWRRLDNEGWISQTSIP